MSGTEKGYTNLGKLVMALADHDLLVKIGKTKTLMSGDVITLKITLIKGAKSFTIDETISMEKVAEIADPAVVAYAILERIKRM